MIEFNGRDKNAALVDFSRAARIAPSPLADYWVGRALEDAGQLRDAANAYQAALQLAPGMSEAQQRLDGLRAAMP
jgi:tetratricopeptide (TPR) repeat protein